MSNVPPTPAGEPVLAVDVCKGDRLVFEGRVLTVTADPAPAAWSERGWPVHGLEIETRDGTARLILYRLASEILFRLPS